MPEPPAAPASPPAPPFEFRPVEELEELHRDGRIKFGGTMGPTFDLRNAFKTNVMITPGEAELLLKCFKQFVPDRERVAIFKKHYREKPGKHIELTQASPIRLGPFGEVLDGYNRLACIMEAGPMDCFVIFEGRAHLPSSPKAEFEKLLKQFEAAEAQYRGLHVYSFILPTRMPPDFMASITDDDRAALRQIWRDGKTAMRDTQKYKDIGQERLRQRQAILENPATAPIPQDLETIRVSFSERRSAILGGHAKKALPEYIKIVKPATRRLRECLERAIMDEAQHDLEQCQKFGLPPGFADFATRALLAAHCRVLRAQHQIEQYSLTTPERSGFLVPDKNLMVLFCVDEPEPEAEKQEPAGPRLSPIV